MEQNLYLRREDTGFFIRLKMYYLIICKKKQLFYETFDDKEALQEHINSRKKFFHKIFNNHQAYIVKGEEIFTAKKQLDEEKEDITQ